MQALSVYLCLMPAQKWPLLIARGFLSCAATEPPGYPSVPQVRSAERDIMRSSRAGTRQIHATQLLDHAPPHLVVWQARSAWTTAEITAVGVVRFFFLCWCCSGTSKQPLAVVLMLDLQTRSQDVPHELLLPPLLRMDIASVALRPEEHTIGAPLGTST